MVLPAPAAISISTNWTSLSINNPSRIRWIGVIQFTWVRMILVALNSPWMVHDRQWEVICRVAVLDRTRWNSRWLVTAFCGSLPRCHTWQRKDPIHGTTSFSFSNESTYKHPDRSFRTFLIVVHQKKKKKKQKIKPECWRPCSPHFCSTGNSGSNQDRSSPLDISAEVIDDWGFHWLPSLIEFDRLQGKLKRNSNRWRRSSERTKDPGHTNGSNWLAHWILARSAQRRLQSPAAFQF